MGPLLAAVVLLDRTRHLFFLLLDKELLHGILFIVIHDQILKLLLLLEQGPLLLSLRIAASPPPAVPITPFSPPFSKSGITHQLCHIIFLFLIVTSLVPRMIHSQQSTKNCCAAEIVHCKICAALVLVFEEGKASTLAGFLVANEVDMDRLSVL